MALSTDDPGIRARRAENRAPVAYADYIQSAEWRRVRNQALRDADFTCQRCGRRRDLQVHHRTYARLGWERPSDLEVVCFVCHRAHHSEAADHSELGIYLTVARRVLAARGPWTSIADLADEAKHFCADHDIPQRPDLLNRALQMVTAMRTSERGRPYVSVVQHVREDSPEPTHGQACEWLTRVFGQTDVAPLIKPMASTRGPLTEAEINEFRRKYVWHR